MLKYLMKIGGLNYLSHYPDSYWDVISNT